MPDPRPVIPGRFYLITRRTAQQQYLLFPDPILNNAYLYILALAASFCRGISVLGTCVLSNHHHLVIYDATGEYPRFVEYLHRMIARCFNTYRGRNDAFWSCDQVNVVRLEDHETLYKKLVYMFTNPIKHRLVAELAEWPGVNTLSALVDNTPIVATRPTFFFKQKGAAALPKTMTLQMSLPAVLGDRAAFIASLQRRIEENVDRLKQERQRCQFGVLGLAGLARQSWKQRPRKPQVPTKKTRNRRKPTFAITGNLRQLEIAQRDEKFLRRYRKARRNWLLGKACKFPAATYWLRTFAYAPAAKPRCDTFPTRAAVAAAAAAEAAAAAAAATNDS